MDEDLRAKGRNYAADTRRKQGHRSFGGLGPEQELALSDEAAEQDYFGQEFMTGVMRDTMAGALLDRWSRPGFETDPSFNPVEDRKAELDTIPFKRRAAFLEARSGVEFDWMMADMQYKDHEDRLSAQSGAVGGLARMAGSMVDVDLPIAMLPFGGQVYTGNRMARMLKSGAMASGSSMAITAGAVATRGDNEWAEVPLAGMMGALLGSSAGGVAPSRSIDRPRGDLDMEASLERAADEFGEFGERTNNWTEPGVKEGFEPDAEVYTYESATAAPEQSRTPDDELVDPSTVEGLPGSEKAGEPDPEAVAAEIDAELSAKDAKPDPESTVGAATNPSTTAWNTALRDVVPGIRDVIEAARTWAAATRIDARATQESAANQPSRLQRGVLGLGEKIANNPFFKKVTPDHIRLMNHPGAVFKRIAYDLFESPTGHLRNHRTASILKDFYHGRIMSETVPVEEAYVARMRANGKSRVDTYMKDEERAQFNKELIMEMNVRRRTGAPVSQDKWIKQAADALERADEIAFEIARGQGGERPIAGFREIQQKRGYFPQVWKPTKISEAMRSIGKRRLTKLIARGYMQANPGMTARMATQIAKAVQRRMKARQLDADTSMISLMDADGRAHLEDLLRDGGANQVEIDAMMNTLFTDVEQRGRPSFAKGRVEIDMSVKDGDVSLIDLFEHDPHQVYGRYARQMSGSAALARKGLGNAALRNNVVEAALQEQEILISMGELDPKAAVSREEIEGMVSHFAGAPIAGGVSDAVRRAKWLTDLVLLNQLGLTQLAETGRQVWATGIKSFFDTDHKMTELLRSFKAKGDQHPLFDELRPWAGRVGEEHIIFRDEYALDEARDPKAQDVWTKFDGVLRKARRLQGWTSGFYQAKSFQHRLATITMADKLASVMTRGGTEAQMRQMKDLGLSGKTLERVKSALKKHATFDANGRLDRLNIDQWGHVTREDFILSLNRHAAQAVQRALAGEEPIWLSKDFGAVLLHLKRFPLLALSKQIGNSTRVQGSDNGQMIQLLALTMGSAALAYIAKEGVNNALTPGDAFNEGFWFEVGRGALSYSNITGGPLSAFDPLAAILGLEDYRMYQYGPPGRAAAFSVPTVETINRVMKLPGALGKAVNPFHDMSPGDVAALKAIPIAGGIYGASAAFNLWKKRAGDPDSGPILQPPLEATTEDHGAGQLPDEGARPGRTRYGGVSSLNEQLEAQRNKQGSKDALKSAAEILKGHD